MPSRSIDAQHKIGHVCSRLGAYALPVTAAPTWRPTAFAECERAMIMIQESVRAGLARAKDQVICAIPMPEPPRGDWGFRSSGRRGCRSDPTEKAGGINSGRDCPL